MLWLPANGEWAFLVISLCLLANVPLYTNVPVSCFQLYRYWNSHGWISSQRYSLSMDGKGNVYQTLTISKTQRKRQDERVNGVLTLSFKVYVCVSASCVDFAAWQHPYVNIFKHVRVEEWKRSAKQGDVSTHMVAFRQNTQPLHLVCSFGSACCDLINRLCPYLFVPPEQDAEVFSVPHQGSCSCQQLHPGTKEQRTVSGADRPLLLPALQAGPWEILCGPPGCLFQGIRQDFFFQKLVLMFWHF